MFTFISVLFTANAMAAVGKGHVSGKITNITSISSGLLVRINANEVPEHCTSGRVWMLIKQENKEAVKWGQVFLFAFSLSWTKF